MNYKKPRPYTPPDHFNRVTILTLNRYLIKNPEEDLRLYYDEKGHNIYAFNGSSVMISHEVPSLEVSEKILNCSLSAISDELKEQTDKIVAEADNSYISTGYEVAYSGKRHRVGGKYRTKEISYYECVDYKNRQLKYFRNNQRYFFSSAIVDLYSGSEADQPFVLKNKYYTFIFPSAAEPLMMIDPEMIFDELKKENTKPDNIINIRRI